MIKKKICILGSFAVGKTSLLQRFVHGIYSDRYLTTLGVKIDKKVVQLNGQDIDLILWDLAGEDEFITVQMSYLRGAAGFLVVVDGTRHDTLQTALSLQKRAQNEIGPVPFVILINKVDLEDEWQINDDMLAALDLTVFKTSAKTGQNVEEAIMALVSEILEN